MIHPLSASRQVIERMINLETLSCAFSKICFLQCQQQDHGNCQLNDDGICCVGLIVSENSVKNNNVHKCDGSVDLACEQFKLTIKLLSCILFNIVQGWNESDSLWASSLDFGMPHVEAVRKKGSNYSPLLFIDPLPFFREENL